MDMAKWLKKVETARGESAGHLMEGRQAPGKRHPSEVQPHASLLKRILHGAALSTAQAYHEEAERNHHQQQQRQHNERRTVSTW